MLDPITPEELDFIELWYTPQALLETLFHDWDNFAAFDKEKFGELRLYQYSMMSQEAIIDFDLTAEHNKLTKKQAFQLRKTVGDLYCFGARKYGKSLVAIELDMINDMMTSDGTKAALGSVDLIHIKRVLDPVKTCLQSHPICSLFEKRISGSPDYSFVLKNGYLLNSVNANLGAKNVGSNWLGLHVFKVFLEESSLEPAEAYEKRKDAISEVGAIFRCVAEGSLVLMSDMSVRKIEDIRIGDKILAWDDKVKAVSEATVLNAVCTGTKDVINISTSRNDLWLTPDHRILVNSEGEPSWRWVSSIYTYQNKYNVKQFSFIKNMDAYYRGIFLGLLDSDGSISRSGVSPIYRLHQSNEIDFFRFILEYLKFTFSEDIDKTPERGFSKLNKPVHTFRISTQNNAEIDKMQDDLFISLDMQYGYLAGFIIGDGWIGHSGALDLTQCAKNEYKINKIKRVADLAQVPYNLRINREDVKKFAITFHKYSFPFLSFNVKKCQTYRERMLNVHRGLYPQAAIKLNGFKNSVKVYDLETTTGSFIANGFIVHNCSGMTDFTPHSPAGQIFYAPENYKYTLNYPQYVSPMWDDKERQARIEQYGGEQSIGFRVYVKGEVVEDGVTAFDLQRIRQNCIVEKKHLQTIELTKDRFKHYQSFIIVERPVNAERIFVSADIGLHVTEINIMSEVNGKFEYIYNITLNNLTDDEQATIFKYIAHKIEANVIAIDCGDGQGRAIYNELEKTIPVENLVWYDGSKKVAIGFETDKDGNILIENGRPVEKYEIMAEWSVNRLKNLFYTGKFILPEDYKLIAQLSKVVATTSGTRTIYKCMSMNNDHLFDSFKVFAIAEWLKASFNETPKIESSWGVGATN